MLGQGGGSGLRIDRVTLSPYSIRLKSPWQTSKGICAKRHGWYIHLYTQDGLSAVGEAAPMEEAGTESHEDCLCALEKIKSKVLGANISSALSEIFLVAPNCPAARCGFEMAFTSILAQAGGETLAYWLNKQAANFVKVNASAGNLQTVDECRLANFFKDGISIVKLKVGLGTVKDEIEKLKKLSAILPSGVQLRLDANGAWSFAEAQYFIHALNGLPIESLEEPLKKGDWQALGALQQDATFALAVDETLPLNMDREQIFQSRVRRVVLKPMAMGGPLSTFCFGQMALRHNMEVVVTTTIDALPACAMALFVAAALDPFQQYHHGIATANLLDIEIPQSFNVRHGEMSCLDILDNIFQL